MVKLHVGWVFDALGLNDYCFHIYDVDMGIGGKQNRLF